MPRARNVGKAIVMAGGVLLASAVTIGNAFPPGLLTSIEDGCSVSDVKVDGQPTPIRTGIDGEHWNLPQGRVVTVEANLNGKPYRTRGLVADFESYPRFRCSPPGIHVEWLGRDTDEVKRELQQDGFVDIPDDSLG